MAFLPRTDWVGLKPAHQGQERVTTGLTKGHLPRLSSACPGDAPLFAVPVLTWTVTACAERAASSVAFEPENMALIRASSQITKCLFDKERKRGSRPWCQFVGKATKLAGPAATSPPRTTTSPSQLPHGPTVVERGGVKFSPSVACADHVGDHLLFMSQSRTKRADMT
jgi:hypothetical protein